MKNVNGGILGEHKSTCYCKQSPCEKSLHNEMIIFSKLLDVKQDEYDNLFINDMYHRAMADTK